MLHSLQVWKSQLTGTTFSGWHMQKLKYTYVKWHKHKKTILTKMAAGLAHCMCHTAHVILYCLHHQRSLLWPFIQVHTITSQRTSSIHNYTALTPSYLLSQDEWWHPQHWSGYAQSVSGHHTLHHRRWTASQGHWMWCCWQEHDGKAQWQQYYCLAAVASTCLSAAGGTGAAVWLWQMQQTCK